MSSFVSSKRIPDDPLLRKIHVNTLTTTSSSFQNATGAVFSVEANKAYWIEFLIAFRTAATTTGLGLSITAPASPTELLIEREVQSTTDTAVLLESGVSNDDTNTVSSGVASTSVSYYGKVTVLLVNGANAGDVQLRFRSEVNTSQVTLRRVLGTCLEMP